MLPNDFQFSQSSLQDFADCPRRFYLRYIRRVNYPAAISEPLEDVEAHMARGDAFHALAHGYLIGIDKDELAETITDDQLAVWWESWLRAGLRDLPPNRTPEITLTAPLAGYRLIAKYDLIALDEHGRVVIADWKTSLNVPKRERLLDRLQTLVYRYVLVEAGHTLNDGKPITPDQVNMMYWFAVQPEHPILLGYDAVEHERTRALLTGMIKDIQRRCEIGESAFELTNNLRRCDFCQYRSLDERGTMAGNFYTFGDDGMSVDEPTDFADDLPPDFTLDQIAEIEF